jgi:hypothetical protein|tara:strand:+ start:384 stop:1016 length:633 start_codon:yes stop_codon:yes gene_type:complete
MEEIKDVKISHMVLGTTIAKFDLPMRLVDDLNKAYDESKEIMPYHNSQLAGKIKEEKLVNAILTDEMKGTFLGCFKKYLELAQKPFWVCLPENAWINDMYAGEYNPLHFHSSKMTDLGLSSVFVLKRPSTYGIEASKENDPTNGWLQFTGGDQSPISVSQLAVDAKPGEFYVFPYTLLHGVYPFNGTEEARRTMSYNCNLFKESAVTRKD